MPIIERSDIDLIVFDFDGVLTDNRVFVFSDGSEAVVCNRADGLAFDFLRKVGLPAHIVSTEKNPVVEARGRKLQIPVLSGVSDKESAVRSLCKIGGHQIERVMFVGNDINDLAAMECVGYAVAVADSHPRVLAAADHVLASRGGEGVAREIVELVISFDPAF